MRLLAAYWFSFTRNKEDSDRIDSCVYEFGWDVGQSIRQPAFTSKIWFHFRSRSWSRSCSRSDVVRRRSPTAAPTPGDADGVPVPAGRCRRRRRRCGSAAWWPSRVSSRKPISPRAPRLKKSGSRSAWRPAPVQQCSGRLTRTGSSLADAFVDEGELTHLGRLYYGHLHAVDVESLVNQFPVPCWTKSCHDGNNCGVGRTVSSLPLAATAYLLVLQTSSETRLCERDMRMRRCSG